MRLLFIVGLLVGTLSLYAVVRRQPAFGSHAVSAALSVPTVPGGLQPPGALLTDVQLRDAADWLLAAVNPDLPQNQYFTPFAQEKLRWMNREHSAGRLELGFLVDTASGSSMPSDVFMAAIRQGGHEKIFIAKRRFADFLLADRRVTPPLSERQKNDFALGLVHEILHAQNRRVRAADPQEHMREEFRAWREVNREFVRHLRSINQPMDPLFLQADDALRACRDEWPCIELGRLVRLHQWDQPIDGDPRF